MPNAKQVYNQILSHKNDQPTVIFDLDSTLYNVSHRTQRIIYNFSRERDILKTYPKEAERLHTITVEPTDWGMREAFLRAQFAASPEFISQIKKYWQKHFFSSELLNEDIPDSGAVDFVNAIAKSGAQIFYLTGRDAQNMKTGTIDSLKKWNFPTRDIEKSLIMKPVKAFGEDEDFKAVKIREMKSNLNLTWFFENEPVIIHKVKQALPEVKIVWLDTTHSKKAHPPDDVFVIKKYELP